MSLILPENYDPHMTVRETQEAIKYIRDTFQREFGKEMNLERISAPRKKNSRAVLKSRNYTTPRKSIPPRSGKSRASTRMTVSPAYIPRSVTVLTR